MSTIAVKLQKLSVLLLCFLVIVLSQSDEFIFEGFKAKSDNITLNGHSEIEENGILKLTNDTPKVLGHAFYKDPILFKKSANGKVVSFSTAFAIAIIPQFELWCGHGMAFVISSSKDLKGALPNQYLGLVSSSDNVNSSDYILAVEFDTVRDLELFDINDNHVGIDLNAVISNSSVNATYFGEDGSTKEGLILKSGKTIQAWVDYDSLTNQLNVTLSLFSSKPRSSILSLKVDLSPFFRDYMYVGFSASTGLLYSSHYVYGWSFKTNGIAQSLDLSSLAAIHGPEKKNVNFIIGASVMAVVFIVLAVLLILYAVKIYRDRDVIEDWERDIAPHRFSYKELKQATRRFDEKNLLGYGGFGRVYRGILPKTQTQVAVKQIHNESKHGLRDFVSEIASIGRLRHRNLVQLLGWCRKKVDLLLVYELMPNGSLDKYIFEETNMILSWDQRFKIIKGVASGLLYLHEEWEQAVIHRDIKAANVMLDIELNGRLGDFGLAKLYEHGKNASTTRVVGTLGYIAPELTRTGKPTTFSDVFGFGALLLEVVCGRRPVEQKALPEELILVDWVWDKWKNGSILEAVDPKLEGQYDKNEVMTVIKLGLMCSSNSADRRPGMRQVVRFLEGESILPEVIVAPDEYDRRDDQSVGFEDFIHPYSASSFVLKTSTCSSGCESGYMDVLDPSSKASSSSRREGR